MTMKYSTKREEAKAVLVEIRIATAVISNAATRDIDDEQIAKKLGEARELLKKCYSMIK